MDRAPTATRSNATKEGPVRHLRVARTSPRGFHVIVRARTVSSTAGREAELRDRVGRSQHSALRERRNGFAMLQEVGSLVAPGCAAVEHLVGGDITHDARWERRIAVPFLAER